MISLFYNSSNSLQISQIKKVKLHPTSSQICFISDVIVSQHENIWKTFYFSFIWASCQRKKMNQMATDCACESSPEPDVRPGLKLFYLPHHAERSTSSLSARRLHHTMPFPPRGRFSVPKLWNALVKPIVKAQIKTRQTLRLLFGGCKVQDSREARSLERFYRKKLH